MIKYIDSLKTITEENLKGFFHGWPNPPTIQKHIKILENSSYFWLAVDSHTGNVVGFINAISDKTLCAYIPLLEVLPEYQGKGIGSELVIHMFSTLEDYYMIDLLCNDSLTDFYKRFNMFESKGMMVCNFKMQCGK
ncbi:GNAT family N-acetyltransferase [Clostridium sp.]|uniref:GNAT family N-acetyltransferase n=1 Tax=Clostridium sp. TaxID=1506 RepID=UPI00285230FE|nr:GNAT family N-acetyltransferase [Clostridium sp.]MDR3595628.1 GNAT family N-acetyltransferase [Clostridium sp.]